MKGYLVDAGVVSYKEGLRLQELAVSARARGFLDADVLFLLEHTPVITMGVRATEDMLRKSRQEIEALGVEVVSCNRGGKVTYHGPGQLVAYPVLDFSARRQTMSSVLAEDYYKKLVEVMYQVVRGYNVACMKEKGVFLNSKTKVGSAGVHIREVNGHFVSMHGFSLEVATQFIENYDFIDPCGEKEMKIMSLSTVLNRNVSIAEAKNKTASAFAKVFGYEFEPLSVEEFLKKTEEEFGTYLE